MAAIPYRRLVVPVGYSYVHYFHAYSDNAQTTPLPLPAASWTGWGGTVYQFPGAATTLDFTPDTTNADPGGIVAFSLSDIQTALLRDEEYRFELHAVYLGTPVPLMHGVLTPDFP